MSTGEPAAVGFVGLGNIGADMAANLVTWPGGVWVHDLAPEPVEQLRRRGARVARDLDELARRTELICIMVRDDAQVRAVLDRLLPAMSAGHVVAVHSTVAPDTPAELAAAAADRGVQLVDAPVSGGAPGAADGSLAIMVGGLDEAFAACRKPLGLMGSEVVHAGPIGAGTRMKLARNLLHFVAFTAVGEAQRLAEAAGLDLLALGRIVRHTDAITGGPGAIMHRPTAAPIPDGDPWAEIVEHVRTLGEKDLGFATELARQLGVDVPLAEHAAGELARALGLAPHGGGTG
ncbi:NAD(P)-dependent oxidoreductase [Saccharopolyspora montiporae]